MSAEAYIRQMRSPETWGGAMEITMMARIYVVDISVFSTDIKQKRLASFDGDELVLQTTGPILMAGKVHRGAARWLRK